MKCIFWLNPPKLDEIVVAQRHQKAELVDPVDPADWSIVVTQRHVTSAFNLDDQYISWSKSGKEEPTVIEIGAEDGVMKEDLKDLVELERNVITDHVEANEAIPWGGGEDRVLIIDIPDYGAHGVQREVLLLRLDFTWVTSGRAVAEWHPAIIYKLASN